MKSMSKRGVRHVVWRLCTGWALAFLLLPGDLSAARAQDKDQPAAAIMAVGPTVTMTVSPASSPSYAAPASVNVAVSAYDSHGYFIDRIDLYQNNVLVATEYGDYLSTTLTSLPAGTYTFRATALNENGDSGMKAQTITITASINQPPTVSLATNGATFVAPATIILTATAADSDGSISKVEFYNGGTLIGTDTSAPYTLNWSGVGVGTYSLTARATDNGQATTTSASVAATVQAGTPPPTATYSRIETITYHDNTAKWVLGQVAQTTVNGTVASSTTFDPTTAQQLTFSSFGKLQQTLTYNADGTVATVKDGNNNVTTLSNWKRGIPQNIQYADSTTQSAYVNDNGWIESVTDETGSKTCYAYDAMGRISQITYPSEAAANTCNTSTWVATTQVFEPVASAEYGIAAGHWRQTIATGNARRITYFDALWRPLVTREYDTANEAGTKRFQRFAYDHEGRVTFASYPGTTDALSTGTWTDYDALGRVTSVSQDSEYGLLTTLTQYLSGFQTRVTDPKGNQTTTSYRTYDQPTTDLPVLISHPEGAYTEITRDTFDMPTAITRRNASGSTQMIRRYAYGTLRRLALVVEPETGTTVFGYDGADNLNASASGLPTPSGSLDWPASGTTAGDTMASAVAANKVVYRSYDARNRLSTLSFPDGRGNQVWTYTPDGLPGQITTYNDPGNGAPVVNNYYYNKRRLLISEASQQPGWYTWWLGYGYSANGHLASQTYPTGLAVAYSPNALGQPTQVADTGGQVYASGISYYPNGAIKQFSYGNGVLHTMTQNARQLPARSLDSGGVLNDVYSYDANGNVASIIDELVGAGVYSLKSRWMTYDGLDRLTGAGAGMFGGTDNWHRFSYDALDNLSSWKLAGVKDYAQYVYDGQNRLGNIKDSAGATIVGLGYDSQGNLANKNGQLYVFDYGNRLRETTGKEWYRYDGHGRRVMNWGATAPGALSIYSQAGQMMYREDNRTATAEENVYLGGSLLAIRARPYGSPTPTLKYQHTDALGSPVAVTNSAGAVIERTDWEPYGAAIGKPAYDGIGYTGHVMDGATGLTYMQQRYYDKDTGRFDSVDPVTAYSNPVGMFNRYRYAANNPYRFTDPDGRCYTSTGECMTQAEFDAAARQNNSMMLNLFGGPLGMLADLANGDIKGVILGAVLSRVPGGKIGAEAGFALRIERKAAGTAARAEAAARKLPELPSLDATGKVHGALPAAKDLGKYSVSALKDLKADLEKSVQKRIEVTVQKGSDYGHSERQAAEQQLIKRIEKNLQDR